MHIPYSFYFPNKYILIISSLSFITYKQPAPASPGCNSDTKVFLYYIMHVTLNLPLESLHLLKTRIKIRLVVLKI
jgi:hypothetical protein